MEKPVQQTQTEKVSELMYATAAFGGYEMEEKAIINDGVMQFNPPAVYTPLSDFRTVKENDAIRDSVVYNKKHMGSCPECGSSQLDHGSGCLSCRSCGFSMC
jgi:hypothetical protein